LLIGTRPEEMRGPANRFAHFGVQWDVYTRSEWRTASAPNTRAAERGAGPEECLPSGPVAFVVPGLRVVSPP